MSIPRVLFSALALSFAASTAAFAQGDSEPVEPPAAVNPVVEADLPQPFPPQSPEELAYLDELLKNWEAKSSQVERYQTDFSRWVTDPVFGPAETFKTFSRGEIRYEAPDKGLFRVDSTGEWTPPAKCGDQPSYPDLGDDGKEQWTCDGKSLFEFDYAQRKLVEYERPPEMQGKAIADLYPPFVFVLGAKSETLRARYWVRVTTTPEAKARNEYWLEAYPKRRDEAWNYSKVQVIIDAADFLPSAIKICEGNDVETIYQFTNRSSNRNLTVEELELWRSAFDPKTPRGWERNKTQFVGDLLTLRRELVEGWEEFSRLFQRPAPIAPDPAAPNQG